jgi:hypothetical protein
MGCSIRNIGNGEWLVCHKISLITFFAQFFARFVLGHAHLSEPESVFRFAAFALFAAGWFLAHSSILPGTGRQISLAFEFLHP